MASAMEMNRIFSGSFPMASLVHGRANNTKTRANLVLIRNYQDRLQNEVNAFFVFAAILDSARFHQNASEEKGGKHESWRADCALLLGGRF